MIQVRGPYITGSYHAVPMTEDKFTADGWLRTGDVATMDELGFLRITDCTKDLIKSGGEWISGVDVENVLMSDPAVAEAAASSVRVVDIRLVLVYLKCNSRRIAVIPAYSCHLIYVARRSAMSLPAASLGDVPAPSAAFNPSCWIEAGGSVAGYAHRVIDDRQPLGLTRPV